MRLFFMFGLAWWVVVANAAPLTIYYTSNRQGEVDPCGCPGTVQNGGIARMGAFLEANKKAPAFIGDAGDTFFSTTELLPTRRDEEVKRAHAIAQAYRLMGVDALTPGERDFAEGVDFLKALRAESGVAMVSANVTDANGKTIFPAGLIIEKNGLKIGVTGVADPLAFPEKMPFKAGPIQPALGDAIAKLRADGAKIVILLSHLGLIHDREVAAVGGIDLIIGAHSTDALSKAEIVGKTRIVQPIYQGQQLGVLSVDGATWVEDRLVDLGKDWDLPNAVARLVEKEKDLRHTAAVRGKDRETKGDSAWVAHPFLCKECHAKQYDFWETTHHASAYLTLAAKNQHFDPECISCHSLGFQKPGGFSSITAPITLVGAPKRKAGETPFIDKMMATVFENDGARHPLDSRIEPARYSKLAVKYHEQVHELDRKQQIEHLYAGVSCENCHGSLVGHPGNKVKIGKVAEKTCRGCHTKERSPSFDWAWRARVACPH